MSSISEAKVDSQNGVRPDELEVIDGGQFSEDSDSEFLPPQLRRTMPRRPPPTAPVEVRPIEVSEPIVEKLQRQEELYPMTDSECISAMPYVKGFDLHTKEWCMIPQFY